MTGLAPAPHRDDRGDGSGRAQKRGLLTVVGAFVICPCHLPATLALLGLALGGTAAGAVLRDNIVLGGVVVTLVWAALTARGIWLVRSGGRSCPLPSSRRAGRLAKTLGRR